MQEIIQQELPFDEGDLIISIDGDLAAKSSKDEVDYHDSGIAFDIGKYLSLSSHMEKKIKCLGIFKRRNITENTTRRELIHIVIESIVAPGYDLEDEKSLPNSVKRPDQYIISSDGIVTCVMEYKRLNNKLGTDEVKQLQNYMSIAGCYSGILTNGEIYRVYYCEKHWDFNIKTLITDAKEFEKFFNVISNGTPRNLTRT